MTLILHAGAREVTFAELSAVPTPEPTATHLPVPHHQLVELARYALGFYKHEIVDKHHAVMPDGARYFGVMTLRSPHGDYSDVVGLRNSHDKSFPIGIAFGSRVFVCDNTAFVGDHVIRRKHTAKAKRDLPGLLGEIIAPLQDGRVAQHEKMLRYQNTNITDAIADHAVLEMYRAGVINLQRIDDVLNEWSEPTHDYGAKTAWRLFNAVTFVLAGRVVERPKLTSDLHLIMDRTCGLVRRH